MIHVEVSFSVAATDEAAAVNALVEAAPKMRALKGNLGARVLTDPQSAGAIILLHSWDTMADLDAYRGGPLMAEIGSVLRPIMVAAPVTTVYEMDVVD